MKRFMTIPLTLMFAVTLSGSCVASDPILQDEPRQENSSSATDDENSNDENMKTNSISLTVNGTHVLTATLADNSSADALKALLVQGPLTIRMDDYAGMEKVGSLGTSLPRNDEPTDVGPGDLILYLGSNFVIYYDTNSWNFTRLGKIDNVSASDLRSILGTGSVTVTISL